MASSDSRITSNLLGIHLNLEPEWHNLLFFAWSCFHEYIISRVRILPAAADAAHTSWLSDCGFDSHQVLSFWLNISSFSYYTSNVGWPWSVPLRGVILYLCYKGYKNEDLGVLFYGKTLSIIINLVRRKKSVLRRGHGSSVSKVPWIKVHQRGATELMRVWFPVMT